jgi:hypothetical protein
VVALVVLTLLLRRRRRSSHALRRSCLFNFRLFRLYSRVVDVIHGR